MLIFLVAAGVGGVSQRLSWDYWGGLVIGPVLVAMTIPMLRRTARRGDAWLARLLAFGLVLKMGGALLKYEVNVVLYQGHADSTEYVTFGSDIANQLHAGHLAVDIGRGVVGTGFLRLVTGIVFAVIGKTQLGGFLVFAWACFWGLYLFFRAFQLTFPDLAHRRYARLLFFLPSLLYWPSSIGKDAWMVLTLGLAAHGAARILTFRRGWLELVLGVAGAMVVRPHVAALALVAVFAGYLVRRAPPGARSGRAGKLVGLAMFLAGGVVILGQAQKFLNLEQVDSASITQSLGTTSHNTAEGGSSFTPVGSSPPKLPLAIVTVLFRPFPFEATGNVQQLATSFEGLFLMSLFARSGRRLASAVRSSRRTPYLLTTLVYTVAFCFVFASIGNFGILTRERNQLYPFVLITVCTSPGPQEEEAPGDRGRHR